jgi:hypothetical protein
VLRFRNKNITNLESEQSGQVLERAIRRKYPVREKEREGSGQLVPRQIRSNGCGGSRRSYGDTHREVYIVDTRRVVS